MERHLFFVGRFHNNKINISSRKRVREGRKKQGRTNNNAGGRSGRCSSQEQGGQKTKQVNYTKKTSKLQNKTSNYRKKQVNYRKKQVNYRTTSKLHEKKQQKGSLRARGQPQNMAMYKTHVHVHVDVDGRTKTAPTGSQRRGGRGVNRAKRTCSNTLKDR